MPVAKRKVVDPSVGLKVVRKVVARQPKVRITRPKTAVVMKSKVLNQNVPGAVIGKRKIINKEYDGVPKLVNVTQTLGGNGKPKRVVMQNTRMRNANGKFTDFVKKAYNGAVNLYNKGKNIVTRANDTYADLTKRKPIRKVVANVAKAGIPFVSEAAQKAYPTVEKLGVGKRKRIPKAMMVTTKIQRVPKGKTMTKNVTFKVSKPKKRVTRRVVMV